MDMFSGANQLATYAPKSSGVLPKIETILTGIPSIDAAIKAEYNKLAMQGQAPAVTTEAAISKPQEQKTVPEDIKQPADINKKTSTLQGNWWTA